MRQRFAICRAMHWPLAAVLELTAYEHRELVEWLEDEAQRESGDDNVDMDEMLDTMDQTTIEHWSRKLGGG